MVINTCEREGDSLTGDPTERRVGTAKLEGVSLLDNFIYPPVPLKYAACQGR